MIPTNRLFSQGFWLFLVNIASLFLWNFGPAIFLFLILNSVIIYKISLAQGLQSFKPIANNKYLIYISAICFLGIALLGLFHQPDWIMDIGANTYAATRHLLESNNPYAHPAQLWVETFSNKPNITELDGQVYMFGIPYYFGYPYFPTMALAYTPLSALFDSYAGIRVTNILLSGLNWLLVVEIVKHELVKRGHINNSTQFVQQTSFILLFCLPAYLINIYYLGITDILITSFSLLCFLALGRDKIFIAGLCLGLAQASKLLPAPIFLLAIVCWLPLMRLRFQFIAGFALASLVLVLPFLLYDYKSFLSATILYYLTHHKGGDSTSLWFYLPEVLQGVFLILSPLLTFIFTVYFSWRSQGDLSKLVSICFIAYCLFIAFNKMSHFNYYWGIYPLVCIPLALVVYECKKANDS